MSRYILGIDAGTESIRSGIYDESGKGISFGVSENTNIHHRPGWSEQSLKQWDDSLVESIRGAIKTSGIRPEQIEAIGLDGTSCTVIFMDENNRPLRDAIMWMDIRAAKEAREIAESGDPALKYVGYGNVSAEWFPCKVLWVKRHEPEVYKNARTIFEHTDWLVYRLTGEITGSINTTTIRWFYNDREGGLPYSFYRRIGLEDVFEKLPNRILRIGEVAAGLSGEMAENTGMRPGIPVVGGGADAYIGVIGVNALQPGKVALITGSSQLLIGLSAAELHAPGLFGSFPDAILPGIEVVEAGQISTGSIIKWFVSNFTSAEIKDEAQKRGTSIYTILNERAAELPPGSEGLVVLEHWQGNRTPWVDANSRGVIRGLTLKHTSAHVYRAIMEGVAYGTQVILQQMKEANFAAEELIACGGATQSKLWMQINADVTGKRIIIPREPQAVCLGSAITATVGAGIYPDISVAANAMVRTASVVEPNLSNTRKYEEYVRQYIATYENLKEASRQLVQSLE